jgi:hypothetical protein
MIDFETVIRHFGSQAVALQLEEADSLDDKALAALKSHNEADRVTTVRHWLYDYQVFQGISGPTRSQKPCCYGLIRNRDRAIWHPSMYWSALMRG